MAEPEAEEGPSRIAAILKGFLVLQGIALAIAFAVPITPSKTGSTWSPAELVTADPNYLQKVVASFVSVNGIIAVLGVVVWLSTKIGKRD
jgi:hypothetical protein